jgi:hypothetical protein
MDCAPLDIAKTCSYSHLALLISRCHSTTLCGRHQHKHHPRRLRGHIHLLTRRYGSFIKQSPTDALSQGTLNMVIQLRFLRCGLFFLNVK